MGVLRNAILTEARRIVKRRRPPELAGAVDWRS
jgi:hypothetical protein